MGVPDNQTTACNYIYIYIYINELCNLIMIDIILNVFVINFCYRIIETNLVLNRLAYLYF